MVNIWEYASGQPDIQLVTVNGERYEGYVYMVFDAEEADDVEDVLALSVDGGRIRHFHPSEIAKIERIE
jgi:hypothetical protein